jgi:hypothetical protein
MQAKTLLLTMLLVGCSFFLFGQRHTISGFVSDAQTGERLPYASVYEVKTQKGASSNNYGFYSITLPEGKQTLQVSFLGYATQKLNLNLLADTLININLSLLSGQLDEVLVTGKKNRLESTQMSMFDVSIEKLNTTPVILGESDVLKVMQLMPGVKGGTEGTSGIYVRGGSPEQNLFLLDGVPVYNANHLFGFFSVFNPDALKSVKLYKGGFPARYGGRLSSVVDIRMKEGNMKRLEGNFSIGLISSKLSLEGPIVSDKTSFIISARRTYLDLLAKPALYFTNRGNNEQIKAGAYFHDLNAKVNHIISDRSRLFLSAYYGKDRGYSGISDKRSYNDNGKDIIINSTNLMGMDWGNSIASFRWNYIVNKKLFSNTTLTYSNYNFGIELENSEENLANKSKVKNSFNYYSGIRDISAKADFDYFPVSAHNVKFGLSYTNHLFSPGITQMTYDNIGNTINAVLDSINKTQLILANDVSVYIEDEIIFNDRFSANAGFHLSALMVQGEAYFTPQPRFSARFIASNSLSLKTSYSRMAQHVHLLTTSGISLPTDLWLPATKRFAPPVSDQFALGFVMNTQKELTFTIEGYYKSMYNLIEYKDGASFIGSSANWEDKVEKGEGYAYGLEVMMEKSVGKTTGWVGYTLSWSTRQFENLNFGKPFPAKYDNRHDINISLSHKVSEKFDMGLTWVYNTGNAVTLGIMEYNAAKLPGINSSVKYLNPVTEYSSRNNYRLPAYHRLDVGANFHKKKKHGTRTWSISAYNAYNRLNPFLVQWKTKEGKMEKVDGKYVRMPDTVVLEKFSLFPIIPSVSYSYKF